MTWLLLTCTGEEGCGTARLARAAQATATCFGCGRRLTATREAAEAVGASREAVAEARKEYNRERAERGGGVA